MNEYSHKNSWIGLAIGFICSLVFACFYYGWVKKETNVYFHQYISENKFRAEYQKWALKNPFKAREIAVKIWKELEIYEELKNETDQEKIEKRLNQRMEELSDTKRKEVEEKSMKLIQEHAPSFLSSLEENFPLHLRYYWLIIGLLILASSGIGLLVGYSLEPEHEKNYYY